MNSSFERLNPQIREEASEWLVSFSEGDVDENARAAFTRWLRTSPEHIRAYLRVSAFWHDAELIDKATRGDIDGLVARALSENNVVSLREPAVSTTSVPERRAEKSARPWAIAAALAIVCIGALFAVLQFGGGQSYATGIGELRTLTLADGSKVELNACSRINVRFSDSRRYIELLEGQARFSVQKDAARPFVVRSGSTDVKAVGTQFDVNRKSTGTVVTVFEGRVAISQPTNERATRVSAAEEEEPRVLVSPGEQVTVTARTITPTKQTNLAAATAWTEGLLVFDSAPLSEVVQEFNRHNLKPMEIADQRLLELRISGVFPASGAERLTGFLHERFGVSVQERDEVIRLSSQPQGAPDTV